MDLRALRTFVTIADCGSVSGAAQILHIAQPSLSRQLQRFESDLGLTLFDRTDRRMTLTASGHRMLPVARDLITRVDLAHESTIALRAGAPAALTVGAPHTTAGDIVAPWIASWGPDDPLPMVWETTSRESYATLERGADLAIGAEVPPRRLSHLTLADLPVWAYAGRHHPWAQRSSVELAELEDQQLLVLPLGEHSRTALERALAAEERALGTIVEFLTADVAQAVASSGRGVAVVTDRARYGLNPLPIVGESGPLTVRLHAAWNPQHHSVPMLETLAKRLREFTREKYGNLDDR